MCVCALFVLHNRCGKFGLESHDLVTLSCDCKLICMILINIISFLSRHLFLLDGFDHTLLALNGKLCSQVIDSNKMHSLDWHLQMVKIRFQCVVSREDYLLNSKREAKFLKSLCLFLLFFLCIFMLLLFFLDLL